MAKIWSYVRGRVTKFLDLVAKITGFLNFELIHIQIIDYHLTNTGKRAVFLK